ncbi:MAG: metalloregulator ArsR/SmtB family transcription factor, partial [Oscillospiraceae bacterium]|nr:metalloregulator ArsR/SmtB family transcription factor [Oscillospiraceae bacterium]
ESVRTKLPESVDFYNLSELYKMFADSTRVKILYSLSCSTLCVCDLAQLLNMSVSAISHQLKSLRQTNLVRYERQGKNLFYSLADDHVREILKKGFEHIHE